MSKKNCETVFVLWGSIKVKGVNGITDHNPYIIGIYSNRNKAEEVKSREKNATEIEEFRVIE